jgi:hypothetical protein
MAKCKECKEQRMVASVPETIAYRAYEEQGARNWLIVKRLVLAIIVSVILLFASNALWLLAWTSYDYSGEEVIIDSQDGGNANYIGNDGDIVNGEDSGS